ncbi:MAG: hypothetical protein HYU37_21260 [Acidobacteria bacterium]|nr:hypothetical protein [Acidobacteriota bacterium]
MRVPDLQTFRQIVADLACGGTFADVRNRLVIVPTRAAAAHLIGTIERTLAVDRAVALPDFITRDEIAARRSPPVPRRRSAFGPRSWPRFCASTTHSIST